MAGPRRLQTTVPFSLAALLLFLVLLFLSACGDDGTATTQAANAQEGRVVDQAAVAEMELDQFRETVREAADRLVARHGGDEGGFYAMLLALDRGYDGYQLLTGSVNDRLDSEGRITGSDGSEVSPAREPEGALLTTGDSASGTDTPPSTAIVMLASLSDPVFVADTMTARQRRILFCDGVVTLGGFFSDVRDRYLELEAQEKLDAQMYEKLTFLTTVLGARGYGVQQIVEGILLDQVRVYLDPQGEGTICYYIEHTSGSVLRPVHAPLDPFAEMTCPAADKDAPAGFDPEAITTVVKERGLDKTAGADTDPEGGGAAPAPGDGGTGTGGDDTGPPNVDLNGEWIGSLTITKAMVNGTEVSNLPAEGCDYTAIYRVTHTVAADLEITPDGKGSLVWAGDTVALDTGHTQTLEGGGGPLEWTWEDGWLELVVHPERGGQLVIRCQPEVLPGGTVALEGVWTAGDSRPLFDGEEDEADLEAEGVFSTEKPAE